MNQQDEGCIQKHYRTRAQYCISFSHSPAVGAWRLIAYGEGSAFIPWQGTYMRKYPSWWPFHQVYDSIEGTS